METMESMRMKRMLMTLKKALDVSVSTSSSVSLRKCLEKECVEDPELVKQIFDTKQVEEEDLVAQVLQHLRKEMEVYAHINIKKMG
jgi:hypothetical protein